MTQAPTEFTKAVSALNHAYEQLHVAKEDAFWAAYMGLTDDADKAQQDLNQHEIALKRWITDPGQLKEAQRLLTAAETARTAPDATENRASDDEIIALRGWVATFTANVMEDPEARVHSEALVEAEGDLARARGTMELGYRTADGFTAASSVKLSTMLRAESNRELRQAAWQGLRDIETFVLEHGFLEIVKRRNQIGRALGGADFYDATVRRVEGMTQDEIFALLDELEEKTREAAQRGLAELKKQHGDVKPWDVAYYSAGDITTEEHPYLPFSQSFSRWGRSFAALGVGYNGAELVLDLLDRKGKHENGFMHGPVPAWRDKGEYRPARIQFTANAIPGMVGSGRRALETFFHEGGHAAHFANIDMPSPCFAQEFAPTSVAFAEVQSMFMDSLVRDADWQTRYARTIEGEAMPFELMQRAITARQPMAAWGVRQMLVVPYFERALYRMTDAELTPENVLKTAREVEQRLLFMEGSSRPVLSIPHLLSIDASAYYHGYVLAEMGVHQTRDYFLSRDGRLVDNPTVGPELSKAYWRPGNSRRFGEFLESLTGEAVTASYLAADVNLTVEEKHAEAEKAIAKLKDAPVFEGPVDLDATIRVDHGNETMAGGAGVSFEETAEQFEAWIEGM